MDIKSIKTKIGKQIVKYFLLIIPIVLAFIMLWQYPFIGNNISKSKVDPFENKDFVSDIFQTNQYLYFKMIQDSVDENTTPGDIFLDNETAVKMAKNVDVDYYSGKIEPQEVIDFFNKNFKDLGYFIKNSNGNLKYYMNNTKENLVIENFDFPKEIKNPKVLSLLNDNDGSVNDIVKKLELEKEKLSKNNNVDNDKQVKALEEQIKEVKSYQKYINSNFREFFIIHYNESGNTELVFSEGMSKEKLESYMLEIAASKKFDENDSFYENKNISTFKMNKITDTNVYYAIPKNLSNGNVSLSSINGIFDDSINEYVEAEKKATSKILRKIVQFIILILFIIAVFFPRNKIDKILFFNRSSELPLELNFGWLIFAFMYLDGYITSYGLVTKTIDGTIFKALVLSQTFTNKAKFISNAINIGYWYIYFALFLIIFLMLKKIYAEGIIKYLKRKSVIVKLFLFIFRKIIGVIRDILNVDYKKTLNVYFIILMFINIIIVTISCYISEESLAWYIGIIIYLIVFSFFWHFIKKELNFHQKKYNQLIDITKSIGDGNLDNNLENIDVGMFNPVKNELVNVQSIFKKAVEEEIKSQKMKNELISNVSHDLKTPLTSIINYVDLIKDKNTTKEQKSEYLNTIDRKSQRLKVLIEDLFEISKTQSGSVKIKPMDIDIIALLKQSIFEVSNRLENSKLKVKLNIPYEKYILNLDGEKTYRVFENIIVNISKYALPNTRVHIGIIDAGKYIQIYFRNISATELDFTPDDIVDRFIRGDRSRNTEGSGLGLAISKSYVELQQGKLVIEIEDDIFKVSVYFKKIDM